MISDIITHCSHLIQEKPEKPEFYKCRAEAFLFNSEDDKALTDLETALSLDGQQLNSIAWMIASGAFDSPKLNDAAVRWAQQAVAMNPDSAHVRNTLGVCQYRAGDWDAAISMLNPPDDSIDGFFLAMAYWKLGQQDAARKWLAYAIEWMETNKPHDSGLFEFRKEAESLIGPANPSED